MNQSERKLQIIHVDMDAFYAAIEQRDNPDLSGKPVVVGGRPNSRGVVSTCSYEARKFGIRSAMPLTEARRRCPQAVFLPVNMPKYTQVSSQIHLIFKDYTPLIESISLDEAFLDVSDSTRLFGSAQKIALEIKERIKRDLDLTASVGLAPNKFLAKIASDIQKPNGLVMLTEERIQDFLDPLPVERIWGVGARTAEKLHNLHVRTIQELKRLDEPSLRSHFGIAGTRLFFLARGIDNRPVETDREAKSIGRETTFREDLSDYEVLQAFLLNLSADVGRRLRKESLKAKTVTIKVRFADFHTLSRSKTLDTYINLDQDIYLEAKHLLLELHLSQPVRLIGVSVHNFVPEEFQNSLFEPAESEKEKLAKTIDAIKERYGEKSITLARLLNLGHEDNL
ncbi:MAG: DNA polymerase IV [Candidatus Dichloromethanomonas elyunquensis]|nr:MAG: DNA polymerase IV [Candidatus Dichloromethanomonas elyunquensis]